ncbi:hypothetical protein Tco_0905613 [Tanacetum coccineum]
MIIISDSQWQVNPPWLSTTGVGFIKCTCKSVKSYKTVSKNQEVWKDYNPTCAYERHGHQKSTMLQDSAFMFLCGCSMCSAMKNHLVSLIVKYFKAQQESEDPEARENGRGRAMGKLSCTIPVDLREAVICGLVMRQRGLSI